MTDPVKDPRSQPYLPADLPFQVPVAAQHQANWPAFDVPRTWDIMRPENDELGWIQVTGFQQMAEVLFAHSDSLTQRRNELANAWQGPAAEAALKHIDQFLGQLQSDARCAATTAHGLDGIMETQATTRAEISTLHDFWRDVTTDWKPEWWDSAAQNLNDEAVAVMDKADRAIRDHRTRIVVPERHFSMRDDPPTPPSPDASSSSADGNGPSQPGSRSIPPIPGYSATYSSGDDDFGLAGGSQPSPAKPGQPVSMLPIPPGNPHAPQGGAYVLPGPGVGSGGYVVPMPQPRPGTAGGGMPGGGGAYGAAGRAGSAGTPGSGGGTAMMPMALGGAAPPNGGKGSGGRGGKTDTVWEVQQGVPPVIEGISDRAYVPGQASPTQEAEFQDWFAQLAYPWRSEKPGNGQDPQVILRKVKP